MSGVGGWQGDPVCTVNLLQTLLLQRPESILPAATGLSEAPPCRWLKAVLWAWPSRSRGLSRVAGLLGSLSCSNVVPLGPALPSLCRASPATSLCVLARCPPPARARVSPAGHAAPGACWEGLTRGRPGSCRAPGSGPQRPPICTCAVRSCRAGQCLWGHRPARPPGTFASHAASRPLFAQRSTASCV